MAKKNDSSRNNSNKGSKPSVKRDNKSTPGIGRGENNQKGTGPRTPRPKK